ncbi:MAG: hypothetical protein LZF60_270242 [Nitrospira sp.]|nr:MAG: hypothetical protein LZF60_270242 [Nitrospira sp.]
MVLLRCSQKKQSSPCKMAGSEGEPALLLQDSFGRRDRRFPLDSLDFTVFQVENRADLGRYEVHTVAASGSSSVDDWADRRRAWG